MQTAPEPPATTRGAPHSMSVFSLVDAETLRKTVESLSSSTCELDICDSPRNDRPAQNHKYIIIE